MRQTCAVLTTKQARRVLKESVGRKRIRRIDRRPRGADRVCGHVVAVGREWALLAQTRDGGFPDGFVAIRIADVVRVSKDQSFESRFAQTLRTWPPNAPTGVDLDSVEGVLRTLPRPGEIFGIERGYEAAGCLQIGRFARNTRKRLWIREVRPDATWESVDTGYRMKSVTAVTVRDSYITALSSMACEP